MWKLFDCDLTHYCDCDCGRRVCRGCSVCGLMDHCDYDNKDVMCHRGFDCRYSSKLMCCSGSVNNTMCWSGSDHGDGRVSSCSEIMCMSVRMSASDWDFCYCEHVCWYSICFSVNCCCSGYGLYCWGVSRCYSGYGLIGYYMMLLMCIVIMLI